MGRKILLAACLAFKDWQYEKSISFCAVLALASMLVPLLTLLGIKNGVIEAMREKLLEDPAILIITPKSDAGKYDRDFIARLAKLPGAAFAIGRIRAIATDVTFSGEDGKTASIVLEPAANGEPILARYGLKAPEAGQVPQIILSSSAAKTLGANIGSTIAARLGRRTPSGKFESEKMLFSVQGILPSEAADRKMAFTALDIMENMEDYRDYFAVPERNFSGNAKNAERNYASFRLYAKNLDSVENLVAELDKMKIETITRAREIAGIRLLESAINQVIFIISVALASGFIAFTLSSAKGSVARKRRMLGMLKLLGFPRIALALYPVAQNLLTALCGLVLSFLIYMGASLGIESAFRGRADIVCRLKATDIAICAGIVIVISLMATAYAAWQAGNMQPSDVIREN